MGYAGGTTSNPTYRSIGDHTETLEVDFDSAVLTYEALLEWFGAWHDPTHAPWSRQYRSAIFYRGPKHKEAAESWLEREEERRHRRVHTAIEPLDTFYRAEDYHQKYVLRSEPRVLCEFQAMYPDPVSFTDSTAVARANGYLGGHGTPDQLQQEVDRLGLSDTARRMLQRKVR